jgi:non-heme chloroperoxidase
MSSLTDREQQEIERANAADGSPVVFVHGMWLLASSWDRWRALFEASGYVTLAPGWPDDPETVAEARQHPELFARKRLEQITKHVEDVIRALKRRPAVIGHSMGGLIVQKLAGMGLADATISIGPAPFRGVLALPLSAVKAAFAVLENPANCNRAVALRFEQFRFAFANAVSETEAKDLYDTFAVPASGALIFQVATANLHPATAAKIDCTNPRRGAILIISGQKDNFIPGAMSRAAYRRQKRNPGITEFQEIGTRGHSLTIDGGWTGVAESALKFVKQHHPPQAWARSAPARRE